MSDKKYIEDILAGSVPSFYRYDNTTWYKNISSQIRHTFISILTITAIIAIILVLISDVGAAVTTTASPVRLINLFTLSLLTGFLIILLKNGHEWYNPLTLAALGLMIIFLPICLFVFQKGPFYIINLLLFPLCVNYMFSEKKAMAYNHAFLAYAVILFLLDLYLRREKSYFTSDPYLIFTLIGLYQLLYYSNLFVIRKNIKDMQVLIKEMIYDSGTKLPQMKVMQNCSLLDGQGLFMEISVENYIELRSTFGYEVSEEILVQLARNLLHYEEEFRYAAFKLKGVDFGLVFPGRTKDDHEQLLRLLRLIKGKSYLCNGQEIYVRLTAGVTHFDATHADQILLEADSALMEARRKGLELQQYAKSGDMRSIAKQSLQLYAQLVSNIRNRSLAVNLQPIFSTVNNEVIWYELLLRLRDARGNYCSVAPFLSLAGSSGLDYHFSSFVLSKAIEYIQEYSCYFSINITVRDTLDNHFLRQIRENALRIKRAPGVIVFEILEIEDVEEGTLLPDFINLVHDIGCLVAIDDFGTGYSNYNKLLTLNIDILKIDGSLIQNFLISDRTRYIVKNIVSLCLDADIKIVAEFVDSEPLFQCMADLGIHYLQGYFIGKPQNGFIGRNDYIVSDIS